MRDLRAENERLKTEVNRLRSQAVEPPATGNATISYDLNTNLFRARHLHSPDLLVDELEVRVPHGEKMLRQILSPQALMDGNGRLPLDALGALNGETLTVEKVRVRIPEDSATRTMATTHRAALEKEGIENLEISFESGNRLTVRGTARRLVRIPFELGGRLGTTPDGKIKFRLEDAAMLKILPVPRMILGVAQAMLDGSTSDAKLQRDGNRYLLDPADLLPRNVRVALTRVGTQDGHLVIEGRAPAADRTPRTLLME